MNRTKQMQIRIEPELKTEAEAILSRLGLKPTEYIRMALSQLVLRKGLPFEARIPNSDTVAALEEPARNLRQFDSTREVFADLEARSETG
ncbi:MAG: type II toxin-antitoxin system RelB/DinJ family antitoxin [Gammaproteobacteria bacterium]|nr:type II toxin-antitoxin system RelB/DinJ family antitoxin [Gammaproteobacteria bacterium]